MTIPPIAREIFRDIGIGCANLILFVKHGPEVYHTVKEWLGFAEDIERRIGDRRNHMGVIQEVEALVKIVPLIEKVLSDVKAAEQTPQVAQLVADLETIVAAVKGCLGTAPAAS